MKFWTLEILGFIWALPVTVLGLLLLLVSCGWMAVNRQPGLRFWFMLRFPWWWPERFNAMNMGAVYFFRDWRMVSMRTRAHENEHNRQCRIFGPFILILWPLFFLAAFAYGKPYRACWLEIMARWKAGQGLEP